MTDVATLFRAACAAELLALKPGNVHIHAAGHGMTVADFQASAEAAAAAIARPGAPVGARLLAAVQATRAAVGQNTNLGILLLAAPLAAAAERPEPLPRAAARVLRALTVADARAAYAAIRLAAPGGLGRVADADVRDEPAITLLEAMRQAAGRDRIAWNYAHGLRDVFRRGVPRLRALQARGWTLPWAITGTYLALLARTPDSHVARKHGVAAAAALARRVAPLARRLLARERPETLLDELLALDAALKREGINPGTTADLVVASLLARALMRA
jgi:triphosphoribosyl-dephospho-CoA synthase